MNNSGVSRRFFLAGSAASTFAARAGLASLQSVVASDFGAAYEPHASTAPSSDGNFEIQQVKVRNVIFRNYVEYPAVKAAFTEAAAPPANH